MKYSKKEGDATVKVKRFLLIIWVLILFPLIGNFCGTVDSAYANESIKRVILAKNILSLPTLTSCTVQTTGTSVICVFSQNMSAVVSTGWTLNTPTDVMTYSSGTGTSSITFTTATTINSADTPTVSYVQPGTGWTGAGGYLASITNHAVTNSSTQSTGIDLALNIQHGGSGGDYQTTVTKPTGTVDGDFLLMAVSAGNASCGTLTATGWTLITKYIYNGTDLVEHIYYKRAASEGATYTFDCNAGAYTDAIIWRITGVVTSGSPLDVAVGTNEGDGTAISNSAIVTATNGAAVIQIIGTSNDYTTLSGTTLTERYDDGVVIAAAGSIQASAGSSGTKSGTIGTSRAWGSVLLALKPQ